MLRKILLISALAAHVRGTAVLVDPAAAIESATGDGCGAIPSECFTASYADVSTLFDACLQDVVSGTCDVVLSGISDLSTAQYKLCSDKFLIFLGQEVSDMLQAPALASLQTGLKIAAPEQAAQCKETYRVIASPSTDAQDCDQDLSIGTQIDSTTSDELDNLLLGLTENAAVPAGTRMIAITFDGTVCNHEEIPRETTTPTPTPPESTTEFSTTPEESSTSPDETSSTMEESTTPDDISSTIDETSTTNDETSTTNDETSTTNDETSTTNDETSTTNDETSTTDDETSTTNDETSTTNDETSTTNNETSTTNDETSTTDCETSTTNDETSTTNDETSTSPESSSTVDETSTSSETSSTLDETSTSPESSSLPEETSTSPGSSTIDETSTSPESSTADVPREPLSVSSVTGRRLKLHSRARRALGANIREKDFYDGPVAYVEYLGPVNPALFQSDETSSTDGASRALGCASAMALVIVTASIAAL